MRVRASLPRFWELRSSETFGGMIGQRRRLSSGVCVCACEKGLGFLPECDIFGELEIISHSDALH